MKRMAGLWFISLGLLGCGAAIAERPPSPAFSAEPPESSNPAPAAGQASESVPASPAEIAPSEKQATRDESTQTLLSGILHEEELALASGSTCVVACRALASMRTATQKLCEVASDDAERSSCEQAKRRLRSAEQRVFERCGVCGSANGMP